MKREVRDKKEKLFKQTLDLKKLYWKNSLSYEKGTKIREEQSKVYDKWNFYQNMIKAEEKIKCKNNEK